MSGRDILPEGTPPWVRLSLLLLVMGLLVGVGVGAEYLRAWLFWRAGPL